MTGWPATAATSCPATAPPPLWRRILTQLRDPLVLVLLGAAAFTIATSDFTDAGVIVYRPSLRDLLGTQPVAVTDLLIVGAAAILGYAAIRLDRLIHPRGNTR
jgi:Ca2+-transporting ATPase